MPPTSTAQVIGTNDSCTVSKASMAAHGYSDDPCVQFFVSKPSRRAPLIHLGYFARMKALEQCIIKCLQVVRQHFQWLAQNLRDSAFILYEQIRPDDGFGQVMMNHFSSLGSPLLNVAHYPDIDSQQRRFKDVGWNTVVACDLSTYWDQCVSLNDKTRIGALEPFDEFEEFWLKCMHYILVSAGCGELGTAMALNAFADSPEESSIPVEKIFLVLEEKRDLVLSRFSHCAAQVREKVFFFGGFGLGPGDRHSRLDSFGILNTETFRVEPCNVIWKDPKVARLSARMVAVPLEQSLIIIGGRRSPSQLFPEVLRLRWENNETICEVVSVNPLAERWRHVACWIFLSDAVQGIFVHGGKNSDQLFGDTWLLTNDFQSWKSLNVEVGQRPCARHSHSVCCDDGVNFSSVFISGGIGEDHHILSDVWKFSGFDKTWKILNIHGLQERIARSAVIMTSARDRAVLNTIFNPLLPVGELDEADLVLKDVQDESEAFGSANALEVEGILAAENGNLEKGLECFEKAILLAPEHPAAYNNRAQVFQLLGRTDEALRDLNKAIELSRGEGRSGCQALTQRGCIMRKLGRDEDARSDFEAAACLGNPFAKTQMVQLNPYAALCNKMLSEAMFKLRDPFDDAQENPSA
ncbi:unnamed protein product [Notodromas monacha]|uniref:Tetratricopeptide repeat protein n=1 Tax=Notodromas monacha TaxID=399045 RepID=A0A7R9BPI9_9CRUS|nr:unnamed protein product [Notodromas monacha]CAG0917943.1 unnamed protein product [Notodromas monacha]